MNQPVFAAMAVALSCTIGSALGDENAMFMKADYPRGNVDVETTEVGYTAGGENVGTTEEGLHSAPPAKRGTCKQGFVWREAVAGDRVCVMSATRDQAKRDNAAARGRRAPGASPADTCVQGYVWREVTPKDHVCVTPQMRQQVLDDNKVNAARTLK